MSALADNPLLQSWDTPFGLPPFDRIRPEHFPPAFDQAMSEHAAEIAAIAAAPEPPDFANTIEALERSGRTLTRVGRVFDNLTSSATSEALDAIDRDYAPRLAAHHTRIMLDAALFARVDALYRARETLGLAPEQKRLLERYHLRFVRAGALLGPEQKARMAAITERLATLHTLFGQNVLHDEDEWRLVLDEADLEGLPEFARAAAAAAAAERGLAGKYVDHPGARLGRAVSDVLGAPRPAPHGVRGLGGARRACRRARQPAADRRDHGTARRAGAAARLRDLRRLPARRHDGEDAAGRRRPAAAGLGAGPSQGRRGARRTGRGGAGGRAQRADRDRGTGATTPRRCGSANTRSTRPS